MSMHRVPLLRGIVCRVQSVALLLTRGFTFGSLPRAYGWPALFCVRGSHVTVGSRLSLVSQSVYSEVGVAHPCVIRTLNSGARIDIGSDVGMSGASVCCAESVRIGDRVMFGADSVVTDTDFHAVHSVPRRYSREGIATGPVVIEDDVFVGMRAIILKGVRVGRGAVIGANSVVTQDVPENAIVAGSPARNVGWVDESRPDALRRCEGMQRP